MNPLHRRLLMWGVPGLVLGLVGFSWTQGRSADLAAERAELQQAQTKIAAFQGSPADLAELADEAETLAQRQAGAVSAAAKALVVALPGTYQSDDALTAAARVRADASALRQAFAAKGAILPAQLPFENGQLDGTATVRRQQLMKAWLHRLTLETCLEAGVPQIRQITVGDVTADPSATWMVATMGLQLVGSGETISGLVRRMAEARGKGIGLRRLGLVQRAPGDATGAGMVEADLEVSLLTTFDPALGITPRPHAGMPAGTR